MKYDFSGWATKNDLQCSDGRVIRHGAFKECDGETVPLVWQHMHDSPDNILGHALLENRDEGVYAYCSFNDTPNGEVAREVVNHGDVCALSIYANKLKQQGQNVLHGAIREVSLVLAGANPGALIDNLAIAHSDGYNEVVEDEAIIYNGFDEIFLSHQDDEETVEELDDDEETVEEFDDDEEEKEDAASMKIKHADGEETIQDVFDTMSEEQQNAAYAIIGLAMQEAGISDDEDDDEVAHADDDQGMETEPVNLEEVFNTLSDKQKEAIYAVIGLALDEAGVSDIDENDTNEDEVNHSGLEDYTMKHNVFDGTAQNEGDVLSHAEMTEIFAEAKRMGSLKDAVLQHGITNIDVFFPDAQMVGENPAMISRPMEWVVSVLNDVHKTPFSKVKSTAANITADEARARGYVKGNKKIEEVISALKREVTPQTIYKLQKLDRDDIVDITDFDVVAWIKQEMRTMLDEEVARAILVGDGRDINDNSKIKETNIIPIWKDDETYAIHTVVDDTLKGQERAEAFIDAAIRARKDYRGSGSPSLYVGTDLLTEMRLIRDKMGHRLYKNDQELADEMRVSKIVEVQILDNLTREDNGDIFNFGGIIVNLTDYNCGSTKGGEVNMFDDFDIDYNKYEYLIETRLSGALYVPKSAMVVEFGEVSGSTGTTGTTGTTGFTGA